jgi:putative flippase GtrA
VDAEANGSPLSIGSAHVSVVVAALVEIVIRVSTVSTVGVYGVDDYGGSVVGTCVSWVVGAMWVFKNIS